MKHTLLLTLLLASIGLAQTNYVALDGLHVPPFTNWLTAATNIQDAVDVALDGDCVLVMTGEYASGGRPAPGNMLTNRLVVTKPITVQSVLGPEATIIAGAPDPVHTNGPQAVRGTYLANGAILSGFTITRGHTMTTGTNDVTGGGVYMLDGAGLSNAHVVLNEAYVMGGGIRCLSNAWIVDAVVMSNGAAGSGGGVILEDGARIHMSIITYNSGIVKGGGKDLPMVGGIHGSAAVIVKGCVMRHNQGEFADALMIHNSRVISTEISSHEHPHAPYCVVLSAGHMEECCVSNNSKKTVSLIDCWSYFFDTTAVKRCYVGRNANENIITRSTLVENSVIDGSGATGSTLSGAEVRGCTLYNIDRSISTTLYNSIVYGSTSYVLNANCDVRFSCGAWFSNKPGCITSAPLFRDAANGDFWLRRDSPCINAGTNVAAMGAWDMAGQPRVRGYRVDIGAYEFSTTGACIAVTERVIDFGAVLIGETATNAVRVVNLGDEPVIGMATNVIAPFSIIAGAEYTVQSDAYHDVTLTFTPFTESAYSNTLLLLGGGDERVTICGTGVPEPYGVIALCLCVPFSRLVDCRQVRTLW